MAEDNRVSKHRCLTACICLSVLLSCSGLTDPSAEIHVAVEMSAVDFNAQETVKKFGNPLDESESDFWGTDKPHKLIIDFPRGKMEFDGGGSGHGTILASTPLSPTSEITSVGRIRSVTFSMFREKFSISEAVDIAENQCKKIEQLFDDPAIEYGQKFHSYEGIDIGDGFYICRVWNEEIESVVSLTKISLASRSNPPSAEFKIDGWVGRNTDEGSP